MEDITKQIERIKRKLSILSYSDENFEVFGAKKHKYKLNQCLSPEKIALFERENECTLPEPYKLFLIHIGNGGAGPNYGLEPLEDCLFNDLDYKTDKLLNPGKPFPYVNDWNLSFTPKHSLEENESLYYEELDEFENLYFNPGHINGSIRISNLGCGIYENMVVSGSEKGNIWVDSRVNDGGIYPNHENGERISFLDWYELWVDESAKKVWTPKKSIFGDNQVVITSAVLTVWLISHYFNGMMMNLLFCWFIILPALVLHIISLFTTIRSAFANLRATRLKLFCHGFVLLLALGIWVQESDLFKPERILTAVISDDHYFETLILRKNGTTEMYGTGLTGNTNTYYGSYKVKGNLIIFTKRHLEKDVYSPDTLYWDKKQNMLFISKDSLGNFITEPSFLNHFDVINLSESQNKKSR